MILALVKSHIRSCMSASDGDEVIKVTMPYFDDVCHVCRGRNKQVSTTFLPVVLSLDPAV
jgi:hypothetical protein